MKTAQVSTSRDRYGALVVEQTAGACRSRIARAWRDVERILVELRTGHNDEHVAPVWETGAEFDRRGGGEAINVSLYGVDTVAGQALGVVQVRQWRKRRSWRYAQLRKNYFFDRAQRGQGPPVCPRHRVSRGSCGSGS